MKYLLAFTALLCDAKFSKLWFFTLQCANSSYFTKKWVILQDLFLKKITFFTQVWIFGLVLLLVYLKQHMTVGEGSVNPPKSVTIWLWPWSYNWCRRHRPDTNFWWHQQCWKKMWPFRFTCKVVIVRSSNFLLRLQL